MSDVNLSSEDALLKAIKEVQKLYKMTGVDFARKLGVDPAIHSKIINGVMPPSKTYLMALMREIPELTLAVVDYMKDSDSEKVA